MADPIYIKIVGAPKVGKTALAQLIYEALVSRGCLVKPPAGLRPKNVNRKILDEVVENNSVIEIYEELAARAVKAE